MSACVHRLTTVSVDSISTSAVRDISPGLTATTYLMVTNAVSGHPSISLPQSPLLLSPSTTCISPTPLQCLGTIPKADDFHTQRSNDSPEVDSPNVINFWPPPLLVPQEHQTSLRRIGTCPCDTMAPSTVMWIPIYGRLGTRRLGTVILSISCVV
jgi:hypothetical protein